MSRNLRNAALAFVQRVLGALSGAVGMFFIAREMPNAEFHLGVVGFGLSLVGMFLAIQRAFDDAHVKRISEGRDLGQCNSTYFLLNLGSTAALILLVLGGVFVWTTALPTVTSGRIGGGFQSPFHVRVIELMIAYQALNSIGEYVRRTYEGQQNIMLGQVIMTTEHVVKGAATVYVAFFGLAPLIPGTRNALGIAGAYVIGAAALAGVAILMMIGQPFGKPSWSLAKSYGEYGFRTMATSTITMVFTNAAAIFLQLFWSARDVGFYFAPNRYLQFLPAVAGALGTALFPVFSAMHAEGRTAPRTVERMLRIVSLILLPVVALSIILPEAIIHVLLSDKFLPGAPVLAILAGGFFIKALRNVLASKLGGVNRPGEVTKASLIGMVIMLTLGPILIAPSIFSIPLFGLAATGAALALSLAETSVAIKTARAARRYAGIQLEQLRGNLFRHGVMFLGTCAAMWGLTVLLEPTAFRFFHLVGAGVLANVVFFGLGFIVGEIGKDDIEQVWELAHPGRWAEFFEQESGRSGLDEGEGLEEGRPEDQDDT